MGETRRVVFFLSLEYGAKRRSSARRFGVADDRHHMSRCQTLNDLVVTVGLRRAAPLPCRKTVRLVNSLHGVVGWSYPPRVDSKYRYRTQFA